MLGQVVKREIRSPEKRCGRYFRPFAFPEVAQAVSSNQSMHKFPVDACRDTVNASALIED